MPIIALNSFNWLFFVADTHQAETEHTNCWGEKKAGNCIWK
jgi:hypothetical protein